MRKTLLLVFIHGFKGGESTFGEKYAFAHDLRRLVAAELPKIDVKMLVYPQYETRGDLGECVERFRDWLLEKVIDLEVLAGTPSPTIDPSVRTVLIGHSMGGIVAAETTIALASDQPVHGTTDPSRDDAAAAAAGPARGATPLSSLMFPYVQGVLAFDTPFLGIAPGVVAHGAEGHYAAASAAVAQLSGIAGLWGGGAGGRAASEPPPARRKALPAPEEPAAGGSGGWGGGWGKVAMVAGAVGAVAAGGAAAYANRGHLTEGLAWASSHLEFVGCLARREELRRRVAGMVRLDREVGVGFANLYTRLGRAAAGKSTAGVVGTVMGGERTFCVVPRREEAGQWTGEVNDAAKDETGAHISMFTPKDNPGYDKLVKDAKQLIARWLQNDWYESSSKGALEA